MNDLDTEVDCAQKLKVLADDTRLAVLKLLGMNAVLCLEQCLITCKFYAQQNLWFFERYRKGFVYRLAPSVKVTASKALNLGCCVLWFN